MLFDFKGQRCRQNYLELNYGLQCDGAMNDAECVQFLQWALPKMRMRWPGFRKVRRQVNKRVSRRMQELNLPDADAYRDYLQIHPEEWLVLDGFCRITISRFYRDRGVFNFLRDDVLPRLAAQVMRNARQVRCWSVGCASGEEIYTLKIIWNMCIKSQSPDVSLHILGTDTDPTILQRATQACYSAGSLKDLPPDWISAAFTASGDLFSLRPEFRDGVDLRLQDIRSESPPGNFHLILCRNLVFTYFEESLQREILDRLLARLTEGGFLVTGKSEQLPCLPEQIEEFGRRVGTYRKTGT
jgi:chemotaxis protein methyltransferase CheR